MLLERKQEKNIHIWKKKEPQNECGMQPTKQLNR